MQLPAWVSDLKKQLNRILLLVFLILSLTIIAVTLIANWQRLRAYPWQFRMLPLIKCVAVFPLGALPPAFVWHLIVRELGGVSEVCRNLEVYSLSTLPRRIPGLVWYIGTRMYMYKETDRSTAITLEATLGESVGLIVSGSFVYLISLLFVESDSLATVVDPRVVVTVIFASLALLAVVALIIRAGRHSRFKGLESVKRIRWSIALSILVVYTWSWCAGGLFFFFFLRTISPIGPDAAVAVIGIWAASGAIGQAASIVQGLGLKEIGMVALLTLFLPLSVAIVVSIATRVVHMVLETGTMLIIWALSRRLCKG
jgi:hypothetical protein